MSINAQAVAVEARSNQPLMSGFHCLFSTGGLLGAVIVSILLELKFELLYCALVLTLIMSLIFIFQWPNLLHIIEEKRASQVSNKFSLPDRKVLFLGVMCFIAFMAEGAHARLER